MSLSHLVIFGLILIIVIPPDKLPEVMKSIGQLVNQLRRSTAGVWDELKKDAAIKPEDLIQYRTPPPASSVNHQKEVAEEKPVTPSQSENPNGTKPTNI